MQEGLYHILGEIGFKLLVLCTGSTDTIKPSGMKSISIATNNNRLNGTMQRSHVACCQNIVF